MTDIITCCINLADRQRAEMQRKAHWPLYFAIDLVAKCLGISLQQTIQFVACQPLGSPLHVHSLDFPS